MNPSSGPGSGGVSIRAAIFAMLFIGFVAASYDGLNASSPTFATNPQMQTAAAPATGGVTVPPAGPAAANITASQNGLCGQTYQTCMANPKSDKAGCEKNWNTCVTSKCVKKDTTTIDSCPKDADCESSCTESATGQGGLLSCCDPAPQHNNACRKKVDGKCTVGFAAGASPLSNQVSMGLPPPGQSLQMPPTGASPSGVPAGSNQIGDAFNGGTQPVPYAQFSQDLAGTVPSSASPASGQTGDSLSLNNYESPAAQAANKMFADDAVSAGPGSPSAGNDPNPFGCAIGQHCDVPTPKEAPGAGAPDPSKPYYIQRGDQWCDQNGNCKDANTFTPPKGQGLGSAGGGGGGGGGDQKGGGGLGSGLSSLFNGMMKGLSQALGTQQPQQAPAQACSTDPNAYAQQQQQYQQQLQQYNYQLQQQQYQQQMNQYYGNTNGIPPTPPVQPTPCTPSTQSQCSTQPSQPAASTCNSGSWQPQYSGNCIVNWKCSSSGNAPTASLSCTPSTADVGMSVSLGYSCSAGTPSGTGFTIADATQRTGTSTVTVAAPPSGTNTATYGLTCNNNGVTSGAQCSIQVTQPSIVLVANPKTVSSGGTSQIGWVTSGMQSCVISSPQQSDFTARNVSNTSVTGSASTSPITANASFRLDCTTLAGQTKSATTQVTIAGGGTSSITATSTADGTTVNHGDHVTINWTSNGEPAGAAVSFWIVDTTTNTPTVVIVGAQPLSGSYSWTVPAATSTCPTDGSYNVCGADLVAGHTYQIEADVYTPSNAYVGDGPPPSSPVLPAYGDFFTGAIFTIGQ